MRYQWEITWDMFTQITWERIYIDPPVFSQVAKQWENPVLILLKEGSCRQANLEIPFIKKKIPKDFFELSKDGYRTCCTVKLLGKSHLKIW